MSRALLVEGRLPWPQREEDNMSSHADFAAISPEEMKMIQSVLKSAGYSAALLQNDQRQYNTAAFLVMRLFLAGETSADALAGQLKRRLGSAQSLDRSYQSPPVLQVLKRALLQISILVIMAVGWDVDYLAASRFSRLSASSATASVSAVSPMPKARSTMRASPRMSPVRLKIAACPLRKARMTSKPLIVA